MASLVTAAILTARVKWMWYDEILTYRLVTDPSWRHMLDAIRAGVDSAPPLYHLLARGWAALFGGSPLSLRLFSVTGLVAALLLFAHTLGRAVPRRAAAFGALVVFCGSDTILAQVAEVRYYGVLCTLVALGVLFCHRLMLEQRVSLGLHAANATVQGALVLTHVYGGMYGGALLLALVAWDVGHGRLRPARWVSYPIGWLPLLLWLPVYVAQRGVVERSWIPAPYLNDLTASYSLGLSGQVVPFVLLIAAFATALEGAASPARAVGANALRAWRARAALLCVAGGLLTVPLMAYAVSKLVIPILYPRYLMAVAYASGIVLAVGLATVQEIGRAGQGGARQVVFDRPYRPAHALRAWAARAAWAGVFVLLLGWPIVQARSVPRGEHPGAALERLVAASATGGTGNIPIVIESAFDYLPIAVYSRLPERAFTFLLDSASASDPGGPAREMLGNGLMPVFVRFGYAHARLARAASFLCETPRFLVVDSPDARWADRLVATDDAFVLRTVGRTAPGTYTFPGVIRLVERRPAATPAACASAVATGARSSASPAGVR